jgi:DNA-binding NarL/FixJ family response regulator
MNKRITVDVSHVDPIVAAGLRAALATQADFDVEEQASSRTRRFGPPPVLVADYAGGLALVAAFRATAFTSAPLPPVLIVTQQHKAWELRRALEAGVQGYMSIGCAIHELGTAVRSLDAGLRHIDAAAARLLADSIGQEALTPREEEVLRCVVEGLGNKAVARDLGIGIGTVKTHLRSIYSKIGAASRTEAVTVAERRGLLDNPVQVSHGVARTLAPHPVPLRQRPSAPAAVERAAATT